MNIKTTQTVKISPKSSNKTLLDTKKVLKAVGVDISIVNEANLDISKVNAIEQFGCSIKIEDTKKFSIIDDDNRDTVTPTISSFQDEADPFYSPDCGKQSAKRIKDANEKTSKLSEVSAGLIRQIAANNVIIRERDIE
jgi:hypothetical protein|tara:strand:- start:4778 stop:5191 length:414 start_codon:yes stop_codon:yes gene_type:complete